MTGLVLVPNVLEPDRTKFTPLSFEETGILLQIAVLVFSATCITSIAVLNLFAANELYKLRPLVWQLLPFDRRVCRRLEQSLYNVRWVIISTCRQILYRRYSQTDRFGRYRNVDCARSSHLGL
ncbi:hypothetical protein H9Q71_014240 [Fusarium xylarioides]|nr:hypothetical protein H9Q71_014240 [Fusarium xylarioides]